MSPKFFSQNEIKNGDTWPYFLDSNKEKSQLGAPASSSAVDWLCNLQEITLPPYAEPASSVETQLFLSLEISLLIQLTTWALTAAQRREWDLSFLQQHRLSPAQGNCETAAQGFGKESRYFLELHQLLTYWECTKAGYFYFLKACLDQE